MPKKTFSVPGLGDIEVFKRRGAKNIRLSVSPDGRVRVSLPAWMPYSAAIAYAEAKKAWLIEQKAKIRPQYLKDGDRIGKSYRLSLVFSDVKNISTRVSGQTVVVKLPNAASPSRIQSAVTKAAERALKKEAERLLPMRLRELAAKHDYAYNSVAIKRLAARWGSCSHDKQITLNLFLMQLPWSLIDYVLIHELVHTKHLNHGKDFWDEMRTIMPDAKQRQKLIRQHRAAVLPAP